MYAFIRSLSDTCLTFAMILMGCLYIGLGVGIIYLVDRFRRSMLCHNIRLRHENASLRRQLTEARKYGRK